MLHELLLALNGHIGGLFIEQDGFIKVQSVTFLHPGEESILNKICEHGSYYLQLRTFLKKYIDFNSSTDIPTGLYMNALCYALRDDILSDYEDCLVKLEEELMMDSDLPLTYIQTKLQYFTLLFPSVAQFLAEIERKKLRGCQLFGLITKYCSSGIPSVKSSMNAILFRLHKVMYKQLSSWLLHGKLMDSYAEFFIHRVKKVRAITPVNTSTNQDNELGIGGLSGEQLQHIQSSLDMDAGSSESDSDCFEQFTVRVEMIPNHIPTRVLHKVLFIGESVDMFENNRKLDSKESILKDKTTEFSKELYALSELREFNTAEFEKAIDSIRSCVTERLWEYVVKTSDLRGTLTCIKNIFLLGRGDIYQRLIESADLLLGCPPSPLTTHDANRQFQQVLREHNLSDDSYQSFRLSIEAASKGQQPTSKVKQNGWELLAISFKPQWPLHVLFDSVTLDRYNVIFRFLLAVKRVHVALHESWKLMMSRWGTDQTEEEQANQGICQLRNHMQFLVDNLQTYLQVDIIESQFTEMLDKIEQSRDFEVVRSTHEAFQTSLLSQCFLLHVPVRTCLESILENCSSFCALLDSCDQKLEDDQLEHLHAIKVMFQKQTLLLFKILTSSKAHQRKPHLSQLLLRIDYNKYFSLAGQQLGL